MLEENGLVDRVLEHFKLEKREKCLDPHKVFIKFKILYLILLKKFFFRNGEKL
jgi:hypothetical protein